MRPDRRLPANSVCDSTPPGETIVSRVGETVMPVYGSTMQTNIGKRYLPKRAILAAALLIALLATAGIVTLQRHADASHQAEVSMAQIEGLTNRLKRLELQAESDKRLDSDVAQQAQEL